jgi:hypothetical protein
VTVLIQAIVRIEEGKLVEEVVYGGERRFFGRNHRSAVHPGGAGAPVAEPRR